jgi:hypothetical protein
VHEGCVGFVTQSGFALVVVPPADVLMLVPIPTTMLIASELHLMDMGLSFEVVNKVARRQLRHPAA